MRYSSFFSGGHLEGQNSKTYLHVVGRNFDFIHYGILFMKDLQ